MFTFILICAGVSISISLAALINSCVANARCTKLENQILRYDSIRQIAFDESVRVIRNYAVISVKPKWSLTTYYNEKNYSLAEIVQRLAKDLRWAPAQVVSESLEIHKEPDRED